MPEFAWPLEEYFAPQLGDGRIAGIGRRGVVVSRAVRPLSPVGGVAVEKDHQGKDDSSPDRRDDPECGLPIGSRQKQG